jgi:hypothetical protein
MHMAFVGALLLAVLCASPAAAARQLTGANHLGKGPRYAVWAPPIGAFTQQRVIYAPVPVFAATPVVYVDSTGVAAGSVQPQVPYVAAGSVQPQVPYVAASYAQPMQQPYVVQQQATKLTAMKPVVTTTFG